MSAVPDPVFVRASEPDTVDHATVVAVHRDGSIVGRATLSRLYGPRAEVRIELAPSTTITLVLIVRLELDAAALSDSTVAALRRWRPLTDEMRASHPYLTWPTTLVNS